MLNPHKQYRAVLGVEKLVKKYPRIIDNITLNIPERPLNGSNQEPTFSPKQSINMGANKISIVLSVDPNAMLLIMKPTLDRLRVAYILAAKSTMRKTMMVKGGPLKSANEPQKILQTAELKILRTSPKLIKWSSWRVDMQISLVLSW